MSAIPTTDPPRPSWADLDASGCSILAAADLIGDRWTLLILRDAVNGVRRFGDFQRHLGISRAVLAERLNRLVDDEILGTREYRDEGQRARLEYALTAKGWGLRTVLQALLEFGDRHVRPEGQHLLELREAATGERVELAVVRRRDGQVVDPRDLVTVPGPGMSGHP